MGLRMSVPCASVLLMNKNLAEAIIALGYNPSTAPASVVDAAGFIVASMEEEDEI